MIDTIVAISTSLVPSAIGLVRLSGPNVLSISEKVISRSGIFFKQTYLKENKRKSIYCDFVDGDKTLDQILFVYFESPNSYTGEDLAEFSFHGNPILLKKSLEVFFKNGARPAKEGEFTKRAYLNQKLDLTQAEAIGRFISARSNFELELAKKNVYGELSRLSSRLRSNLISLKAECEAEIDFSTEDLTYESLEERISRMQEIVYLCKKNLEASERAETHLEEISVVIFGEPNSGKSSLLNLLLGKERAIVSEIPGTTRDFLRESIQLNGFPIQLIDTAGIRETEDKIEKLGIEKSFSEFKKAKIKFFVIDSSIEIEINSFIKTHQDKLKSSIIIANKIDLVHSTWLKSKLELKKIQTEIIEVSCVQKKGIDFVLEKISQNVESNSNSEDFVFLEERNKFNLQKILTSIQNAIQLIQDKAPSEIYITEINLALEYVGSISGKIETEEILARIFSKFCVGK